MFELYYTCPSCAHAWEDEWECACDDTCPACGTRNISPDNVEDINDEYNGEYHATTRN